MACGVFFGFEAVRTASGAARPPSSHVASMACRPPPRRRRDASTSSRGIPVTPRPSERVRVSREPRDRSDDSRAGMGKIPNYFKSAQKELLSLGGKLIDKMKDYDKDNIPTKVRARGVPAAPSLC